MKGRSKAGGKSGKSARDKAATRKHRRAPPKAVPGRHSAPTTQETEIARLARERDQALEREKATAEVLRVVSSSPGELGTVFRTILENATRLCEAKFGVLYRFEDGAFRFAAEVGTPLEYAEFLRARGPFVPPPGTFVDRVFQTKQMYHTDDYAADAVAGPGARLGGARSTVGVPMLKDGKLIGAILVYRQEVRPFGDKQIALLTNFADQAVIAIENARLLSELRQRTADLTARTADLTEALEQQTAASEVLRVISSSPGDLKPVFQVMLENATRICSASFGTLLMYERNAFRRVASHNVPQAFTDRTADNLVAPFEKAVPLKRLVASKQLVHVTDIAAEHPDDPIHTLAGARTILLVPMLKDNKLVGVFAIYRQEVRPFSAKQIELVQNFATQAVVAIENARLLTELRQRTADLTEALEQQTATSKVLQIISSSQGDLEPVFTSMLENAVRICDAVFGELYHWDGEAFQLAAMHDTPRPFLEERKSAQLIRPRRNSITGRMLATKKTVQLTNIAAEPLYAQERYPSYVAAVELGGVRTVIAVPMMKEDALVGMIMLCRQEVRAFTEKQIALVENFAAQAVIAIENARLLNELRQRTDDLTRSLEDLRTAQDRLVQTQKLASLGQLTAGIAHEIKNPLNFVNNFSGVSVELIDELQEALQRVQADDRTRSEIGELADTLRDNLGKVVQHGKRADAIVKNMLLHSREGSGEHRPVDINAIVEEALNLAYHGARAEKQDFAITLQRSFDPEAGQADVFPQDITRVLLNLFSNSFYAATKRMGTIRSEGFQPTVAAVTRSLGDRVEIVIRDNGTGISPEVKEKMFNPFFTTKPAGEGTGLGLSISYDIVVKQHAGSIEVDTQPGEFTEIRITLPRSAAHLSGKRA